MRSFAFAPTFGARPLRSPRSSFLALALAVAASACALGVPSVARAEEPAKAKGTVASRDKKRRTQDRAPMIAPVLSSRADAALFLRAQRVKDLPRSIDAEGRRALRAAAASLAAGQLDAARNQVAKWSRPATTRISHDDVILAALWVVREGAVTRHAEIVDAADRVRFADEEVNALSMTLAELRVAASERVATRIDIPVSAAYSRDASGHEMRSELVGREEVAARLGTIEADLASATTRSDAAHQTFQELEKRNRPLMEAVVAIVRGASEPPR